MKKQERLTILNEVIDIIKNKGEKDALHYLLKERDLASSTAYGYIMIAKEKMKGDD